MRDLAKVDRLVALHLFGWAECGDRQLLAPSSGRAAQDVPKFSSSISDAWVVVEKIRELRPDWRLSILGGDENMPRWWVRYFGVTMGSDDKGEAHNESLPLALSLAALKAIGVEVGDEPSGDQPS